MPEQTKGLALGSAAWLRALADEKEELATFAEPEDAEIQREDAREILGLRDAADRMDNMVTRLAAQCTGKRDRECLYRLAKEVAILDQDFETAVHFRALQTENRPRLPKGHRHAPRR